MEIILPVILAKLLAVVRGKVSSTLSIEQTSDMILSLGNDKVLSTALKIIPNHSQIFVRIQTLFPPLGRKPALIREFLTKTEFFN